MDDVSANFLVDVFRCLPIDCVRKIAPSGDRSIISDSRFAQEASRFVRKYEVEHQWRALVIQLLPYGKYRYGAWEQKGDSELIQVMDVAKFSDPRNLQFDSIVLDYDQYPGITYPEREWDCKIPYKYCDYLPLCSRFPTVGLITAEDEDQVRRIIEACTVPGCVVTMIDIPRFPARCVLEPICSRISTLLCNRVGTIGTTENFEEFLRNVIADGHLETVLLRYVVINDPSIVSALIKMCKEVEIVESGVPGSNGYRKFGPLVDMKTRVSEVLELLEQGHVHRSLRYSSFPLRKGHVGQFTEFLNSKGFLVKTTKGPFVERTKRVGSVRINVEGIPNEDNQPRESTCVISIGRPIGKLNFFDH